MESHTIDFILTWDWEYDTEFIRKFENICQSEYISAVFVSPGNLGEIIEQVNSGRLKFKVLLDRASDTDEAFDPLIDKIILSGTKTLNEARHAIKAMDKATMHLEFLAKGIDVPHARIFSPTYDLSKLKEKELDRIGRPFIIKPVCGGGGEGVIEAGSIDDIKNIHEEYKEEKYLLQQKVFPVVTGGRRAYFRVYYVCGHIIPCWWDDQTHIFGNIVTREEEEKYNLKKLKDIAKNIAKVSKLTFFSTEICIIKNKHLVVIDYVNDPCDMRPKSTCHDGVPDEVVERIIKCIIEYIKRAKVKKLTPLRKQSIIRRRDLELKLLRRWR